MLYKLCLVCNINNAHSESAVLEYEEINLYILLLYHMVLHNENESLDF